MLICAAASIIMLFIGLKPAMADRLSMGRDGFVTIYPNNGKPPVACSLLGVDRRTAAFANASPAKFNAAILGQLKPIPGWCFTVYDLKPVPFQFEWDGYNVINMGSYGSQLGIQCSVADDRMHFTCDWPPYSQR